MDVRGCGVAPDELDARMPAVDGFAIVLGRLSDAIDANWDRAGDEADPDGLHDLRVALRRTRAVVRAGRKVLPATTVEAGEFLRSLTAVTGPARDLDVLVDELGADLGPLGAAVESARTAARAELVADLASPAATAWRRGWREAIAGVPTAADRGKHADRRLGRVVARRLEQAHANVLAAGRELRPATDDDEVHDLRKDARRLRDLLECFGELAPRRAKRFVKHLKGFQGLLGHHQDLVVQLVVIERTATGLATTGDLPDRSAADVLARRLGHERDEARAEFAHRFADYDTRRVRRAFDELADEVDSRSD
jgi:CHAD domain-containing protein